jgi:hypothetical protein
LGFALVAWTWVLFFVFVFVFGGALFNGVYQGIISISPWKKSKKQKGQKFVTSLKEKKIQDKKAKTW